MSLPGSDWGRGLIIVGGMVLFLNLAGCTIMRLKQDQDQMEHRGTVMGRVMTPTGSAEGVYVVLHEEGKDGPRIVSIDSLNSAMSSYGFVLEVGRRYTVAAFQDLNGDLKHNPEEPAFLLGIPGSLTIKPGERLERMDLDLSQEAVLPGAFDLNLQNMDLVALEDLPFVAGEVVSLDAPIFGEEFARDGMWQSNEVWETVGAGVYFLEEYDPGKIPVLFIHGVGGSPTDFRAMIDHLDRERFQPWVFQYPSGGRLLPVARVLKGLVDGLQRQYHFGNLFVTAHSMGGLVARSFVLQTGEDGTSRYVKLLVSFATPYDGHEAAAKGIKYMPVEVPSWFDIQPGSDFLKSLHHPLPAGVPFYLFFGFDSHGFSLVMPYSSDSVVSVKSQLASFAQEEAIRIFGYDLDHEKILVNEAVLNRYVSILDHRAAELGKGQGTGR